MKKYNCTVYIQVNERRMSTHEIRYVHNISWTFHFCKYFHVQMILFSRAILFYKLEIATERKMVLKRGFNRSISVEGKP